MKTIEVSDEMYDSLVELSKELNTQSSRSTRMPYFFQIQTNEKVAVPEGCGTECWHSDGSDIETDDEINEVICEYSDISIEEAAKMDFVNKEKILEDAGWRRVNYSYEHRYQNAFFTERACKRHIQKNAYHYDEPVDYLSYATRNPELELVMKFLCELTGGKLRV